MTLEELTREVMQLPLERRMELMETIARSLREDSGANAVVTSSSAEETPDTDAGSERERRLAAVRRLRGILKTSEPPPSDEELKEGYTNYLIEKYS